MKQGIFSQAVEKHENADEIHISTNVPVWLQRVADLFRHFDPMSKVGAETFRSQQEEGVHQGAGGVKPHPAEGKDEWST